MARSALPWVFLGALSLRAQDPAAPAAGKPPEPPEREQRLAENLIRDHFREEYSKQAPADRLALARKLLDQGRGTREADAERFVFLREARDLAAQAGDLRTALEALGAIAESYRVDAPAMKAAVLALAGKGSRSAETMRALAEAYLDLVEEAVAADDLALAARAVQEAASHARRGSHHDLAMAAEASSRDLSVLQREQKEAKAAEEALRGNPGDPQANLALGRYLFLCKGDSEGGLPRLARGADPALKDLAQKDLEKSSDPLAHVILADGWWSASEREKDGLPRMRLRERARAIYERSLPELSGLVRAKVEKRLAQHLAEAKPQVYVRDTLGETGHRNAGNVYSFELAPNGKRAVLKFWAAGLGSETNGEVTVSGPQTQKQVVYRWSARDFPKTVGSISTYKDLTPITCDVSRLISGPGAYEVRFQYKSGRHALRILRVEVLIY